MNQASPQADPTRRPALALLALVWALIYGRYVVGFAPAGGDVVNAYLPTQQLVQQAIRSGSLPLWNAMTFGGRPLLADIQVGFFYPPSWLHWLLPLALSFAWLLALHGALMFAGCWKLGRRFGLSPAAAALGTVLFCASPFFTLKLSQGIVLFIYGCAWWPWLALGVLRLAERACLTRMAQLALLLALALLAGAPQMAFYGWGLALGLGMILPLTAGEGAPAGRWARRSGWLALAFIAALGLTAIQTLPTAHFIGQSFARAGKTAWDYITDDSFDLRLFWLLLNPGFLGKGDDLGYYFGTKMDFAESAFYVPLWVPALLLPAACFVAVRGWGRGGSETRTRRRVIALALMAVALGVLLALGKFSPLFTAFYAFVPGFDKFRVPARMMIIAVAGLAALAALGLDALLCGKAHDGSPPRVRWDLCAGAGLLLALAAVWVPFALRDGIWQQLGNPVLRGGHVLDADVYQVQTLNAFKQGLRVSVGLVLAMILLAALARRSTDHPKLALALPALAAFELLLLAAPFVRDVYFTRYQERFYPHTQLIDILQHEHRGGRVLWLDDVIAWLNDQNQEEVFPNRLIMHGLPDARGYDPVNARWYGAWCNLLAGLPADSNPQGFMFIPQIARPAWLPLMGVETVISYSDLSALPGLRAVERLEFAAGADHPAGRLTIYRNEAFKGMAWAARSQAVAASGWAGAMGMAAAQADAHPDDALQAIVGDGTPVTAGPVDASYKIEPQPTSTNSRFAYQVDFPQPAMLCFAQSAYPGWGVRLDDQWTELQTLSGAFLMAPVPAGKHSVVFEYHPDGLNTGGMVTLLTAVVLAYGLVRARMLRRKQA